LAAPLTLTYFSNTQLGILPNWKYENLLSSFGRYPVVFSGYSAAVGLGAVMLASVLNSTVAVNASIQVVRAFIRLREMHSSHLELSRKVDALEKKYDSQYRLVFDAIRQLMNSPETPRRRTGITSKKD